MRAARRRLGRGEGLSPAHRKRAKYVLRREREIRQALTPATQEEVISSLLARVAELESQVSQLTGLPSAPGPAGGE